MSTYPEGIFWLEDVNSPPSPPHRTLSPVSRSNSRQGSIHETNNASNVDDKDSGPGSGARTTSSSSPISSSSPVLLPAGLPNSAAGDILSSTVPTIIAGSTKGNVGLPSTTSTSILGVTGLPPTFTGIRKINQPNASSPLAKWQVQPHSDDSDKSSTGGSQPGSPEQMSGMESGRERSSSTSTLGEGSGFDVGGNALNPRGMSPVLAMTPGNHHLLHQQRKTRSTSQSSTGGGGGSKNHAMESSGTSSGSSPRPSPRSSPKRSPVQLDAATREVSLTPHARTRSDSVNSISSQYEQGMRGRSDSGGSVGREGMSSSFLARSNLMFDGRRRIQDDTGSGRERGETMPGSVLGLGVKTT